MIGCRGYLSRAHGADKGEVPGGRRRVEVDENSDMLKRKVNRALENMSARQLSRNIFK